jgi:hypothetical protein
MPQIVDQYGNPFRGALDQIGGEVFTETGRSYTQTIGSANAEVLMDLNGHAVAVFDVRTGALNGTLVFEATVDNSNWFGLPAINVLTEQYTAALVVTTTHAATYIVGVSGFKRVRMRMSAYTSGNVVIGMRGSFADYAIYARLFPSPLSVVIDGGANAIATLTLTAGGAGLFHYITHLDIRRQATAALAGTALLSVTSTNLPGSWTLRVGNAMAAGGTQIDLSQAFASPLKSSVANTNTTVVGPAAGAAVSWSIKAHYYLGA